MRTIVLTLAAVAACSGLTVRGQAPQAPPDLKTTIYQVANSLGVLRGLQQEDSVIRLEYRGTGTITLQGQPYTLTTYRASINYSTPGMRVDFVGTSPDGRTSPRQIHVVGGRFAWNETQPGMNPTPAPEAVNERLVQLWSTPQGVVKAAAAAGSTATVTVEGGATVLTFPLPAPLTGATMKATLMRANVTMATGQQRPVNNLISRVETRLGTVVTDTTYSDYGDWNEADLKADVMFPRRIVQRRGGVTVLDLTVTNTNTYNPYVVMPVPQAVEKR